MSNYYRLIISNLPSELEDPMTELCFRFAAAGVSERLSFVQNDPHYSPTITEKDFIELEAYFEQKPEPELEQKLSALAPEAKLELLDEESRDWLEEWKKGFEPFVLIEDVWVVPSWREIPKEAKTPLFIDPGMAFGTGTHETTQLASQLIRDYFKEGHQGASVLDVGTGTGILALVAKHFGAGSIVGLEIDEMARVVARENLAANKSSDIQIPDYQVEEERQSFDLVIANVIDGVLIDIGQELDRCTQIDGDLILSGILSERYDSFIERFMKDKSLSLHQRIQKGEWEGLWLKKQS